MLRNQRSWPVIWVHKQSWGSIPTRNHLWCSTWTGDHGVGAALLSSYYKLCQQPSVSVFSTNLQTFTAVILDLGARFFA